MRNVTRRIPLSFKISLYCEQEQVIFTNMIFVCKACLRLHQFAQSPGDDLVTVLTQFRILQPNIDDVNRFLNYLTWGCRSLKRRKRRRRRWKRTKKWKCIPLTVPGELGQSFIWSGCSSVMAERSWEGEGGGVANDGESDSGVNRCIRALNMLDSETNRHEEIDKEGTNVISKVVKECKQNLITRQIPSYPWRLPLLQCAGKEDCSEAFYWEMRDPHCN